MPPVLNPVKPRRSASPLMTMFVVDCPYAPSCIFSAVDIDPQGAHNAARRHIEATHSRFVPAPFKPTERA